jgi:hypothetical protein
VSSFQADLTESIGEIELTIQCVAELEEQRLGRKLSQIEIQQIINSYYPEERVEEPQKPLIRSTIDPQKP